MDSKLEMKLSWELNNIVLFVSTHTSLLDGTGKTEDTDMLAVSALPVDSAETEYTTGNMEVPGAWSGFVDVDSKFMVRLCSEQKAFPLSMSTV